MPTPTQNSSPHIDFLQLKNDNNLKPIHYLIKHEDVFPTQKNDSPLILADYGDDQFTLRIQDKGNVVKYTPLGSFSPICFLILK